MTEAEMKKVSDKLKAIEAAKVHLREAEKIMALVNKYGKEGKVWQPTLELAERRWDQQEVSVRVKIPFGVIQQSALDEVNRRRRAVIALGGTP